MKRIIDVAVLLDALPDLYEGQTLDHFARHVLTFVSRVVPADAIAYNEVNLKRQRMVAVINPPELEASGLVEVLGNFIHQHPIVRHEQRTGDGSARKISDFLSRAQYHRLDLYQEVYRGLGAEDQFAIGLRITPEIIIALALNRGRRNFTERDRQALNLLRPHLVQAYRNAAGLTQLTRQLTAVRNAVDTGSMPLVVFGPRLQIKFITRRARTLFQDYFGDKISSQFLPSALRLWIRRTRQWRGRALPNPTESFTREGPNGKLSIRCLREAGSDDSILVLEETHAAPQPDALKRLGLTSRQAEILFWVARGKTNPEIAIILGCASRTVQKHLEHIFEKLGVTTRTDAARRALEVFSPELARA